MYKTLVRSHFDYCDILYHSPAVFDQLGMTLTSLMETIEKIQYKAALAITGTWQGSNRSKLYEQLGWESLSDRRWGRRILQVHKIITDNTPNYLKDKLPTLRRPLYGNDFRNTFHEIPCRNSRYKNSFFPDAIKSWNIMITDFNEIPSYSILKSNILSRIRPIKNNIYDIHDPIGLRYLFQLRVGLSPLNFHKKSHNFADTISDICECRHDVEDIKHFLFFCPLYGPQRVSLAGCVIPILHNYNAIHLSNGIELYLYGNNLINSSDNKIFLESTIKYIKESNRF